jgi:hypothetical protein
MSEAKIKVTAEDNASKVLAEVRSNMTELSGAASLLGGVLAGLGIGSIAGLSTMVRSLVDGIDAMNDLKDATGASIENISALEDVALRTGTSFDTVATSLVKFNGALNSAEPDSKTAKALEAIGLSAKELKAIDPAEALRQTAVALAGFSDDGNKARLTQELFGKSLKEVAPFLKDLSEQGKLNAKVTTEQAQAAENFNKQLFELQKNALDVARSLSGPLVAAINESMERFRLGAIAGKGYFTVIREEQLRLLGLNDGQAEYAKRLEEIAKKLTTGNIHFTQRNALLREQAALQAKLIDFSPDNDSAAEKSRLQRKQSVPDLPGKPDKDGGAKKEKIDANAKSLSEYVKGLGHALTGEQKLTEQQKATEFLKGLGVTGELAQVRELVLGQAAKIDSLKAEEAATKALNEARKQTEKYLDGLIAEQKALAESNQALSEQVEEIGLTKEAVNALRLARLDNALATEQEILSMASANNASTEELALMQRKIDLLKEQRALTASGQVAQAASDTKTDQDKASKQYADTLRSDLKGAFSAAFRDSEDPLGAFGDAIANVMYTRAATALAEALAEAALKQAATSFGGGEGGGNFITDFFKSFDGGGSTGSAPRSGGLDGKGGFMAMLHPQETVLDHTKGQMGVGGGAVNITQNIQIDSRSDQATIVSAMMQAKEMAKAEILRSRQRGGAFA